MDAIYHAEGRCRPNGATAFHYEYTLKDHLGNARVNFRANGTAVFFIEDMHYYPFGMQMEGMGTQNPASKYLYNGKELNDDLGLNWYDYGARWYDAALGRWWSVDPLAEKYMPYSTYNYVLNNPLIFIDPNGMELYIANNENYGQAISDILSLINNAKFKGRVAINFTTPNDGEKHDAVKAEISFLGISQESVDNDAGLSLLDNIGKSDKKYLYEVGTSGKSLDRDNLEETPTYLLGTPSQKGGMVLNLSKTDRGDPPKLDTEEAKVSHKIFNGIPKNGYDAHIIISTHAGDAEQNEKGAKVPRSWFTFHELHESYKRTDKGMPYRQAHADALAAGNNFYLTPKGWDQKVHKNPYARTTTLRELRENKD